MRIPILARTGLRGLSALASRPSALASWPTLVSRPAWTSRTVRITAFVLALALVGSLAAVFWPRSDQRHLTAYFSQTVGLYPGDDVRVLGVPIGKVDRVTAEGSRVRVDLSYRTSDPIPAGARAVIVAPTLVSGRYVQLTPAYTGGAQLAEGATIPESRTAVPVEWDQIEQQITRLATALGPYGANRNGALSNLLNTSAANLDGNGTALHHSLQQLSAAVGTLSQGSGDFFSTVDNLQKLTSALAGNDVQVSAFIRQLDSVSGVLDGNRRNLADTLSTLDESLGIVRDFINSNKADLGKTLAHLDTATTTLADKRQELADILQVAPDVMGNFQNIYDPMDNALVGSLPTSWFEDPAVFICSTVLSLGGTPQACQQALKPLAGVLKRGSVPVSVDLLNRDGDPYQANPNSKSLSGGSGSDSGSGSSGSGLLGLLGGGK